MSTLIPQVGKANGSMQDAKRAESARVLKEIEDLCAVAGVGGRLPRHTELMRLLRASERLVMRSLEQLQRQGRIERRHGSGTYVLEMASPPIDSTVAEAMSDAIGAKSVVVIARPDHGVFDRCLEILYDKAELADLDVVCRLLGQERETALSPYSFGRPRGFILFRRDLAPLARQLQALGHRVVLVGVPNAGETLGVPNVQGHQELGGYLVTKHLIDTGHRAIAYAHQVGNLTWSLRWRGHEKALKEAARAGIELRHLILGADEMDSWHDCPSNIAAYFDRPDAPSAIAAWNDSEAIQFVGVLASAGVSVPKRVSVVGYDNLIEGSWLHPALTTVDHVLDQQIATALDMIASDEPLAPSDRVVFAPTLIIRESTAKFIK